MSNQSVRLRRAFLLISGMAVGVGLDATNQRNDIAQINATVRAIVEKSRQISTHNFLASCRMWQDRLNGGKGMIIIHRRIFKTIPQACALIQLTFPNLTPVAAIPPS